MSSSRKALMPSIIASMISLPLLPSSTCSRPKRSMFFRPQTSWLVRLTMPEEKLTPESRMLSCSTSRQNEWNVPMVSCDVSMSFSSRSRISSAALSVKVNARTCSGRTPLCMRCKIFRVITRVLPDPGPASTSCAPFSSIAFFCAGFGPGRAGDSLLSAVGIEQAPGDRMFTVRPLSL